jgi:bifunctional DNase/RNase
VTQENEAAKEGVVQVFPYGIVVGNEHSQPILVLRDEGGKENLPVFLNPVAATNALFEVRVGSTDEVAPHKFTARLLEVLGYRVYRCQFKEFRGHYQYVDLLLRKEDHELTFCCRADEAIPFCLSARVELYASRSHMAKARSMEIHQAAVNIDILWNAEGTYGGHHYLN